MHWRYSSFVQKYWYVTHNFCHAGMASHIQVLIREILLDAGCKTYWSLTHWGRVTHIHVGNLTIIDSDNDLSTGRCQAIIWTNAGILLIDSLGTKFSEISFEILTFSFKKMRLKLSAKWQPFCLGLNVLTHCGLVMPYSDIDDLCHHMASDRCRSTLVQVWFAAWQQQAITERMLISHQWGTMAFTWEQIHCKCSSYYSVIWVWK